MLFDQFVVFAVGLLVGGFAIHVAAYHVTGSDDYGDALFTALVGALLWALLDGVPLLGPVLALGAWVGVLRWRYSSGWRDAVVIGVVAWVASVVTLAVLALLGVRGLSAVGVPGT